MNIVFKVVDFVGSLSMWKVPDVVLDRLHGTGFENLAKINSKPSVHLTSVLITVLVHLYDVNKRCFVLNDDLELYFGLEDVLKIFGLPIDGKPVIGTDGKNEKFAKEYLQDVNGVDFKGGWISLLSLMKKYENNFPDHTSIRYIRAYVLYIIGCVIYPTNNHTVPGFFLAFLKDIDKIKDYAWGAAMLTSLHRGLEATKNVKGCSFFRGFHSLFLMVFILEHIPKVAEMFNIDTKMPSATFPLVLRWLDDVTKPATCSESQLLKLFRQLTHDDIIWSPYKGLSIPAPYNVQVPMGCSLTTILCMEKWVLHDPTRRADVDHPSEKISLYRAQLLDVHNRTKQLYRPGRRKNNWCEINAEFLKHWDHRKDYLVNLIEAGAEEKDECPSIKAEREASPANSMPKPAINITEHSPAIHGSNHSAETANCKNSIVRVDGLDDSSSMTSPLSFDENTVPLSSLPKTGTRRKADFGGDSSGDQTKINEVDQLFARVTAQLQHAQSPGIDVNSSPARKKARFSAVLDKTKVEVQKLLMMPLNEVALPVNISTLMAALCRYEASAHLSSEKVHALQDLKGKLPSLFVDFLMARKQQEECQSRASKKVNLIHELTSGKERYSDLKHRCDEIDTSIDSIQGQISELTARLKEAKLKRREIQEEESNLKNTYSAKLAALEELEAEFIDSDKELAHSLITQAEVSWENYKQKIIGLGM